MTSELFCSVVFPVESLHSYTYRVPDEMAGRLKPGMRVIAPFGRRRQAGYCTDVTKTRPFGSEGYSLKMIAGIADEEPLFSEKMLKFLIWISEYYLSPPGLVMKSAHPSESGLKRVPVYQIKQGCHEDPRLMQLPENPDGLECTAADKWSDESAAVIKQLIRDKVLTVENTWPRKVRTTGFRAVILDRDERVGLTMAQLRVLDHLRVLPDRTSRPSLIKSELKCSDSPINTLLKKGILRELVLEKTDDPFDTDFLPRERDVVLNEDQKAVTDSVSTKAGTFYPVLVHGVTGSGKTEVYIQAARERVDAGDDVLILVPEISLTPQIAARFRSVFGDLVSIWHSQMTAAQRIWTWNRVRRGRTKVIVGARSALFSPFKNLKLIIIDEEHENSYKQESPSPRYHARDAALYLARQLSIPVILGSATPSLESRYLVAEGRLSIFELPSRFGQARPPEIITADMTHDPHDGMISRILLDRIKTALSRGEQIILLQNRRGYNTVQQCRNCGKTVQCDSCSVNYTYHKHIHLLRCHYCGAVSEPLTRCPHCGDTLHLRGMGTQRVEEHLAKILPDARIIRMDHDTTQNRNAHVKILNAFEKHEYDILLGTQMIAKGLDFPNVTLVGIINADIGSSIPDFRSSEQLFDLIWQVSGRSGRGEKAGRVVIQSYDPSLPAIALSASGRMDEFFDREMQNRKDLNYPPFSRLALIRISGTDGEKVKQFAGIMTGRLTGSDSRVEILGPAPAPIEKLQGQIRWQILVKSSRVTDPGAVLLRRVITTALNGDLPKQLRVTVNIDPMSMM